MNWILLAAAVSLTAAQTERLGIITAPVASTAARAPGATAAATVLDASIYLGLLAEAEAAGAAVRASAADAARQTGLASTQDVAMRAAQAAQAQAAADRARLAGAEARLALDWTSTLRHPSPALKAALQRGQAHVLRLDGLGAAALRPGQRLRLARAGGAPPVVADVLGRTAGAGALAPGPAWLLLVRDPALHAGEVLTTARPTGTAALHPLLPASAVVMQDGRLWYFIATAPGHFQRVALPAGARAVADGYALPAPPPAPVVLAGAATLLAVERRSSDQGEVDG